MSKSFRAKVIEHVSSVPSGAVVNYGEVAAAVGHPGAARAVGNIMERVRSQKSGVRSQKSGVRRLFCS